MWKPHYLDAPKALVFEQMAKASQGDKRATRWLDETKGLRRRKARKFLARHWFVGTSLLLGVIAAVTGVISVIQNSA